MQLTSTCSFSTAKDLIATDLQGQDSYDAIESENSSYYFFGVVTCPVVANVCVAGLFISIVLGVISDASHMVLVFCKQTSRGS